MDNTGRYETLYGDKVIMQREDLYRFTSDAVALSRFAKLKKGDAVADFCAGCGIVGLHAMCLNPEIASLTLYELQPELCALAQETVIKNGDHDKVTVVQGKIQDIPASENGKYDAVLCNPPYFKAGSGEGKETQSERIAKQELTVTLSEIISVAAKKLRFGGKLFLCHVAQRLTDVLCVMREYKIEPKRLRFLTRTEGGAPYLILVEGARGGKPGLTVEKSEVNQCSTL
ncbi:MAG: methyltransferase [Clostridia bacterium]|nr:methyltransferase [Clostridia bacterium]